MVICSCCWSEEIKQQRRIHREIERQLMKDKMELRREIKLILLGTGDSGKSTFIKQMRIIHGSGYTDEVKKDYIINIRQNIFEAMNEMITAMVSLGIKYEHANNERNAKTIIDADFDSKTVYSNYIPAIEELWTDGGIRECYSRKNEYQLIESSSYYMNHVERILSPNYLPNDQDILRLRIPTSGLNEYIFEKESYRFRMVDVGGQRSERRKWIHCFESVTSVIFIAALSEYDQRLMEDVRINRMVESIDLFKNILQCYWFKNSSMMLFLNKKDIFEEKIMYSQSHLKYYFPEFNGRIKDVEAARTFVYNKFLSVMSPNSEKIVYSHFTCATDTENIKLISDIVIDTIFQRFLTDYNMI